jgi:hypothetical protein
MNRALGQAQFPHDSPHRRLAAMRSRVVQGQQILADLPVPVELMAARMRRCGRLGDLRPMKRTLAGLATTPSVEARSTDLDRVAHRAEGIRLAMILDPGVPHSWSFVK